MIGCKVLLAALLLTGAIAPGVGGFAGKGMAYRLPLFLALALVVPVRSWRRRAPYRVGLDVALTVPLLLDTAANAVGFFDRFDRTDDVLHALNWFILAGGVALTYLDLTRDAPPPRWLTTVAATGTGAIVAIIWEAAEYGIMRSGVGGLSLTYGDTIADLLLGTTGGAIGATLATRRWGQHNSRLTPGPEPSHP